MVVSGCGLFRVVRSRLRRRRSWHRDGAARPGLQRLEPRLALAAAVDAAAPVVREVRVPSAAVYAAGDVLTFTLAFNERVTVAGAPTLPVRIGTEVREAAYVAGSGGRRLTFSTRVEPGDLDTDGIELVAGPTFAGDSSIRDLAGNVAAGALPAKLPRTRGIRIDGVGPHLLSVAGPTVGGTPRRITVTATFAEPVVARGRPTMAITVDGEVRQAPLLKVSGATATFALRPPKGASPGRIAAGPIRLPAGAALDDVAGNPAVIEDRGDLPAAYATQTPGGAARHAIGAPLWLGALGPDADAEPRGSAAATDDDTGADDEDGLPGAAPALVRGRPVEASVVATNTTGRPARIAGFVDWNIDGDFADTDETFTIDIPDGSSGVAFPLPLTVPGAAGTAGPIHLRLRLSSLSSPNDPGLGPDGVAGDGEVEDHVLGTVVDPGPLDYGDLPERYQTLRDPDGARHAVVDGLTLGTAIDVEGDGQPSPDAFGDDRAGRDEDGIDPFPIVPVAGRPLSYPVRFTNTTGRAAKIAAFTDWNDDGDFDDVGERSSASIAAATPSPVLLSWSVPDTAKAGRKVALRLRLLGEDSRGEFPGAESGPVGYAPSGEVEDYLLFIPDGRRDFGDLPDAVEGAVSGIPGSASPPDYRTRLADKGPWHAVRPDLFLGAPRPDGGPDLDGDADGAPTPDAQGDDGRDSDDETGLLVTHVDADYVVVSDIPGSEGVPGRDLSMSFKMPVTNVTGRQAYVSAFFDADGTGLLDMSRYGIVNQVVGDGTQSDVTFRFDFFLTGRYGTPDAFSLPVALRIRLSTQEALPPDGSAPDGEVHDEIITVDVPAYTGDEFRFDFGDLPDGPYRTRIVSDGPRHTVLPGLAIGERVDVEVDGAASAAATGDDDTDADDEDGFDPFSVAPAPGDLTSFGVRVSTPAGLPAALFGFVDWNDDGDFDDERERSRIDVAAGLTNEPVALDWVVPDGAAVDRKVAVRLRLVVRKPDDEASNAPTLVGPDGFGFAGEVEDYRVLIHPPRS